MEMERSLDAIPETPAETGRYAGAGIEAAAGRPRFGLFLTTSVLAVIADQLSKLWVRMALPPGDIRLVVLGWVHLAHVHNRGAAWGMLDGQRVFLVGITFLVVFVVMRLAHEITQRSIIAACGLGLILGGAVGNLIDRVLYASVTDFIDLDTPWNFLQTFPVFNLADSALTVGVILLVLDFLLSSRTAPEGD